MANKNLFTKFASLAMAGALALTAVPVGGLTSAFAAAPNVGFKDNYGTVTWTGETVDISNFVVVNTDSNQKTLSGTDLTAGNLGTVSAKVKYNSAKAVDYTLLTGSGVKVSTPGEYTISGKIGGDDFSDAVLTINKRSVSEATEAKGTVDGVPADYDVEDNSVKAEATYNGKAKSFAVQGVTFSDMKSIDTTTPNNTKDAYVNSKSNFYVVPAVGTDVNTYEGRIDATESSYIEDTLDTKLEIKAYDLKAANDKGGVLHVDVDSAALNNGSLSQPKVKIVADEIYNSDGTLKKTLDEKVDYEVVYESVSNPTEGGKGTATITGKGNYTGTFSVPYNIVKGKGDVSGATVSFYKSGTSGSTIAEGESIDYDGNAHLLNPVVKVANDKGSMDTLVKDVDYTVEYTSDDVDDNDNAKCTAAGVVTVKITGINKWVGERTASFVISPIDVSKKTVTSISAKSYSGTAQEPDVKISGLNGPADDDSKALDFLVTYDNNINAGTARAYVYGVGNYTGENSATFKINPLSISNSSSKVKFDEIANQVYTGSAVTPKVTGTFTDADNKDNALVEGIDFVVSYDKNIEKSSKAAVAKVEGSGNFTGTKDLKFGIVGEEADLSKATVTLAADSIPYDGKKHRGAVKSVTFTGADGKTNALQLGKDYTVKADDVSEVGTYDIVVSAVAGGNYGGSITVPFTITGYDVNEAGFSLKKSSVKYNGKNQKPELVVAEGTRYDGGNMTEGVDYEVSGIKNIKNVGKLTVKVTGLGAYAGTEKSLTFKVTKADQPMKVSTKTASVKASKVAKKNQTIKASKVFSVSKNQGSVSYKKTSGNSKIKVASNGKITVKKGLKKGTYKIKVKVTAKGNSNYNSGNKTVKATIKVK